MLEGNSMTKPFVLGFWWIPWECECTTWWFRGVLSGNTLVTTYSGKVEKGYEFHKKNVKRRSKHLPKFENLKQGKRLLQTRWDQLHFFVGLSWIFLFTTFPIDSRCIKFEYIPPCILYIS